MKEIELKGLNEKVYEHKTKEGLRVYIWVNNKIKSTYMTLTVPYGSIHTHFKVNNKTYKVPKGTAHFLEHIKFNVDKDVTAHDLFKKIGGEANAFTSFRVTSYTVYALNNVIENLNTLLDFVYNPYFTKSMVNKEKGIIVEEANMGIDDPYNVSFYEFYKQIFSKSNFRNEITGLPEDINSITIDDVLNVYEAFYHPENMYLIVTGNVSPYEIVKTVEDNLKTKEFKEFIKPKVIKAKEDKMVVKKHSSLKLNVTSSLFRYALKIPRNKFKNIADQELLIYLYILGQMNFGSTSNFREFLREKELVTSFNGKFTIIDDYVVLSFYALTDYYEEVEKAIDKQMQNNNLDKKDFLRKKKAEIANLILKYDDITEVNDQIMSDIIVNNHIVDNFSELFNQINVDKMLEIMDIITHNQSKATMIVNPLK